VCAEIFYFNALPTKCRKPLDLFLGGLRFDMFDWSPDFKRETASAFATHGRVLIQGSFQLQISFGFQLFFDGGSDGSFG